jgi:hypothetical protein
MEPVPFPKKKKKKSGGAFKYPVRELATLQEPASLMLRTTLDTGSCTKLQEAAAPQLADIYLHAAPTPGSSPIPDFT